jgi:hypothetical protein
MSRMQSLQQALNKSSGKSKQEKPEPVAASNDVEKTTMSTKAPSRHGKEYTGAWLNPDFKKSLRLVQISKGGKVYLDDLVAEALNDLFFKYNVPTVHHE